MDIEAENLSELLERSCNVKGTPKFTPGDIEGLIPKPKSSYIDHRINIFEKLYDEYLNSLSGKQNLNITVNVRQLGKTVDAISWKDRPIDILQKVKFKGASEIIIAKVDKELWDLERPLEGSCEIDFYTFDDTEGQIVFWHSSAHILGEASELRFQCLLCHGPPTDQGFFYDMKVDNPIKLEEYEIIEKISNSIIYEKQPFQRLSVSKEDLRKLFKYNKYKMHFIDTKVPDGSYTTVYRCGSLIDLCCGPHLVNTGLVKKIIVTKSSSSYFLGDSTNDALQRLYGISFPDDKRLKEYKAFIERAKKIDHRTIGLDQELFFFHETSPGSCFFLPAGTKICNNLIELHRSMYRKLGYQEVCTPDIFCTKIWETSGHWNNYSEDMFSFDVEKEKWALKPMNCPGHCIIFKRRERSYRELPLRMADFGDLHRNEASGALTGLTRVRKFRQDDAHIFCTEEQLMGEIEMFLKFMNEVYGLYGFKFDLSLSTRPEKYIGDLSTWNRAESILKDALIKSNIQWKLKEGDGAFYGPKIDVSIMDALRRKHQCGTIQLDFQNPERFNLLYRSKSMTLERPVMLHRAIMGSIERFLAIVAEHLGGKWPFWLSPRQVMVIPISPGFNDHAQYVANKLYDLGFEAQADLSPLLFNKKIRNAQLGCWNFTFVIGEREAADRTVCIRNRDANKSPNDTVVLPLDEAIKRLESLKKSRKLENTIADN